MSHAFGPAGRFPSINQAPSGWPEPEVPDPPGYYRGWPLASLSKRCMSGLVDYGVLLFGAFVVAAVIAAVIRNIFGENAGAFASLFLIAAAYGAVFYNVMVLGNREGQTWGKRLLGLRVVRMVDLQPPGKFMLGFKLLTVSFEVITGVAFVA